MQKKLTQSNRLTFFKLVKFSSLASNRKQSVQCAPYILPSLAPYCLHSLSINMFLFAGHSVFIVFLPLPHFHYSLVWKDVPVTQIPLHSPLPPFATLSPSTAPLIHSSKRPDPPTPLSTFYSKLSHPQGAPPPSALHTSNPLFRSHVFAIPLFQYPPFPFVLLNLRLSPLASPSSLLSLTLPLTLRCPPLSQIFPLPPPPPRLLSYIHSHRAPRSCRTLR